MYKISEQKRGAENQVPTSKKPIIFVYCLLTIWNVKILLFRDLFYYIIYLWQPLQKNYQNIIFYINYTIFIMGNKK